MGAELKNGRKTENVEKKKSVLMIEKDQDDLYKKETLLACFTWSLESSAPLIGTL